jgi:transcriptional regulator of PTS gene
MPSLTRPLSLASPHPIGATRTAFEAPAWFQWLDNAGEDGAIRAFVSILMGTASSRSAISKQLRVRSTTVSAWVGALVKAQLVTELPSKAGGRGRPLGQLIANPNRLAVAVFMVHSQALHLVTVNLLGQTIWHDSATVDPMCGNSAMRDTLQALQQEACAQLPPNTRLVGISYSLSGLINVGEANWVFAARWPGIRNLRLTDLPAPAGPALHVVRNMDAQLRARCIRRGAAGASERTLMLHWGYGIGAAFSASNDASIDNTTGFGEIGHWQLPHQALRCRCGHTGCLETVAALWAIGPQLLGERFDDAMDETQTAELLRAMSLTEHPAFNLALQEVVLAACNLCRVFFPSHLVITGPFTENAAAWAAFTEAFAGRGLLVDLPLPRLEAQSSSHQMEQEGASVPLLLNGLRQLLEEAAS